MNELQRNFAAIANATHVAALTAGSKVFFYWGDDKEHVRHRVAAMRIVLIGANLDTEVLWLPSHTDFPACYARLRRMCGPNDLHFVKER